MQQIKPALQFSQGRSFNWSGAALVNCFAEKADGDKREDFAVWPTPGLTTWATVGTGPYRGSVVCAGVLYVVSGGALYSVADDGTATQLALIPGSGLVSMAANYSEVSIAANQTGYVWSGGALHTPVPFAVSRVIYADGYMLWVVADSEQFCISALDDALTYDGADIASVEGAPDNIVAVVNDHREIHFYGETTTEIFYNSGAAAFPFERQGNAFVERGILDGDSAVKMDNTVYFVGNDRIVYALNGYNPQRVSTHSIEYYLRDATYARAWTYSQEGHKFYVLDVNRGTFVFDVATGAWHQRKSWQSDWWRCSGAIDAYGLTLLADRYTGALYTASMDVHDEAGDPIAFDITLPTLEFGRERVTMHAIEVTIETGPGNDAAPDPQAMLTYSDDGGHRWSNEMWRSLGAVGEYRRRVVWRKLGQFRTRQMRLRITDSVRRLVISWWADIG
jgi:hypothetical protein